MVRTGRSWGLAAVFGLALSSVACGGGMGMGPGAPKQPAGHLTVQKQDAGDDAPDGAKTVTVEYKFDRDVVNKDIDKTFDDGFQKKGIDVKQNIAAHSHFDVKDAKITGTVTYLKKGMGHYSIISADLVAEAHYDADVKVDLDVQVKGDTKNAKDGDWDNTIIGGKPVPIVKNMMPTNIPIAGPLFLHAHFDLSAACDVQVEGSLHAQTGVGIAGDVRLAAHYKKDGIQTPDGKTQKFQFESKAPNFELAPKPFLNVTGGKQRVKGRCSLQPTAVLLLENMVGAKMSVEPYVEMDAKRNSPKDKWQLDVAAGVSVTASTEMQFFGRQLRKPKEYTLYEVVLSKPGRTDEPSDTRIASRTAPARGSKGSAGAGMLDAALGGGGSKSSSSGDKLAFNDKAPTNEATKTASDATATAPGAPSVPTMPPSTSPTSATAPSATTATASASTPPSAPIPPSTPSASPSSSTSATFVTTNTPPSAPIPPSTPPGVAPSAPTTTSTKTASSDGIGPNGPPPSAPPEPGSPAAIAAADSDMPPPAAKESAPKKGSKKKGAAIASRGATVASIAKAGSGSGVGKVSGLLKKKR